MGYEDVRHQGRSYREVLQTVNTDTDILSLRHGESREIREDRVDFVRREIDWAQRELARLPKVEEEAASSLMRQQCSCSVCVLSPTSVYPLCSPMLAAVPCT